jgi:hypothetical protein
MPILTGTREQAFHDKLRALQHGRRWGDEGEADPARLRARAARGLAALPNPHVPLGHGREAAAAPPPTEQEHHD